MAAVPQTYGIIAEFETPAAIMHAAEKIRDSGFRKWDVFTPYPVHGMDKAMGLKNSRVGWFSFIGGVTGYTCGMLMIWWMNAVDYPIVIGGKPMFSPFGAFPPCYELTILLGSFRFAAGDAVSQPSAAACIIPCSNTAASPWPRMTASFS